MINIPKVEAHVITMIHVNGVVCDRLVNPPVQQSYMTGEQRKAFYSKLLRNSRREVRRLKRALNP